jgi:hypothetical protein
MDNFDIKEFISKQSEGVHAVIIGGFCFLLMIIFILLGVVFNL